MSSIPSWFFDVSVESKGCQIPDPICLSRRTWSPVPPPSWPYCLLLAPSVAPQKGSTQDSCSQIGTINGTQNEMNMTSLICYICYISTPTNAQVFGVFAFRPHLWICSKTLGRFNLKYLSESSHPTLQPCSRLVPNLPLFSLRPHTASTASTKQLASNCRSSSVLHNGPPQRRSWELEKLGGEGMHRVAMFN